MQLASREREAYGDPLAHKEVIVRRGGARCRVRVAFFSRSRRRSPFDPLATGERAYSLHASSCSLGVLKSLLGFPPYLVRGWG